MFKIEVDLTNLQHLSVTVTLSLQVTEFPLITSMALPARRVSLQRPRRWRALRRRRGRGRRSSPRGPSSGSSAPPPAGRTARAASTTGSPGSGRRYVFGGRFKLELRLMNSPWASRTSRCGPRSHARCPPGRPCGRAARSLSRA